MAATSPQNSLLSLGVKVEEIFLGESCVIVEENGEVDGSWVLHVLLAEFNRLSKSNASKVLLILNSQTEFHWSSLAGKLGWNFNAMKEKGQLTVIDVLKKSYGIISGTEESGSEFPILDKTGNLDLKNLSSLCMAEIQRISSQDRGQEKQDQNSEKSQLLIIVENLSNVFHSSGESDIDVLNFASGLRFPKEVDVDGDEIIVCSLVNNFSGSLGNYFSKIVSRTLATTTFHVKPLQTGFSPKVDGTISMENYPRKVKSSSGESCYVYHNSLPKVFHFKLEDRGVRITPLT